MPISCPPEISELMTNTVQWESFLGFDGHGEPAYAPAIPMKCWMEEYSTLSGGMTAHRRADGTVVEPQWHCYFNADDPRVRTFKLYDRFTTPGVGNGPEQKLQAVSINTMFGPNFDNKNPWTVEVRF